MMADTLIERLASGRHTTGLLVVGDGNMRAWSLRADVVERQHVYLSPLPLPGTTAEARVDWISAGIGTDRAGKLARIVRSNDRGDSVLAAEGYEGERTCGLEAGAAAWSERVWVGRAPVHAKRQAAGLETRLAHAEKKRAARTPASGRGKRPITDEATRLEAIEPGLNAQRVDGWLSLEWAQPIERQTPYVGRGRGSATRAQRVTEKIRSHMTRIARREGPMADLVQRVGWKALVTNATHARRSWAEAVVCSRNEDRLERMFNRLKSRVSLAPLLVERTDHIQGRTYLLTLGVRVFTGLECVRRRSLENDQAQLPGLHPENRQMMTDTPTAERLLKACSEVSRTISKTAAGEDILPRLTPLSELQQDILQRLGLGTSLSTA